MKYFVLGAAAMVMAMTASAAQVNAFCTPFGTFANGAGTLTENCGNFSSIGGGTIGTNPGEDTITGVEIWFVSDYQIGSSSNIVDVTFGTPSAGSFAGVPVTCIVSGGSNSTSNTCGFYSGNTNAPGTTDAVSTLTGAALQSFAATPFSIQVSSAVQSGSVQTSAGDTIVEYDYTVNSDTPEPGSMILLGGGLLAAGLIGRKKLVRK